MDCSPTSPTYTPTPVFSDVICIPEVVYLRGIFCTTDIFFFRQAKRPLFVFFSGLCEASVLFSHYLNIQSLLEWGWTPAVHVHQNSLAHSAPTHVPYPNSSLCQSFRPQDCFKGESRSRAACQIWGFFPKMFSLMAQHIKGLVSQAFRERAGRYQGDSSYATGDAELVSGPGGLQ